jgi:hypothetical protein
MPPGSVKPASRIYLNHSASGDIEKNQRLLKAGFTTKPLSVNLAVFSDFENQTPRVAP